MHKVDPRRWYALAVILLPILLNSFNTYMIQVALPTIQKSLNASFSDAQLIVASFSLSLAAALIISGKLGDIYGRKRLLLIGVSGFTLMAMLGGLTSNPTLLIVIRIVQGLTAALIQPQVLSMMQVNFLPREKGLVFSIYGALMGFGFAFGLILGGILVNRNVFDLGWRTVFFQCSLRDSCSNVFTFFAGVARRADAKNRLDRYHLNHERIVSSCLSIV